MKVPTWQIEPEPPLHKYRKLRLYFAYLFIFVLIFLAKTSNSGFLFGIPVIFLGEAIRLWSHGYLRKAKELATDGPYAYVRNPLYVGNFLIGLGFSVIIWNPLVVALYTSGFLAVYWITIKGEEQRLSVKFKDQFQDYIKHVPRFIPHFIPYSKRSYSKFEFHRITGHGEQITIFAIINSLLFLYLRQEIFQEGKAFTSPELVIFDALLIINSLLLIGTIIQRRFKKNV